MQKPETQPPQKDLASLVDKSELVSDLSHELRTVLGGVIGINELLLASELSSHQRQLSQTIEQSSRALLHVLNDLVDLSRLEICAIKPESAPFDVRKAVAEAAEQLDYLAKAREQKVSINCNNVPVLIIGDATRIRQLCSVLILRLLKSSEKAVVTVTLSVDDTADNNAALKMEVEGPIGVYDQLYLSTLSEPVKAGRKFDSRWLSLFLGYRLTELLGGTCGSEFSQTNCKLWVSLPVLKLPTPA